MTTIRNLIRRDQGNVPVRQAGSDLFGLQRDINRVFDEFFSDFGLTPFRSWAPAMGGFAPKVDVVETDKEVRISAELPGLDEKDVSVTVDDNAVTIKGEKKEEREEKTEQSYHVERSYGSFHRMIPLPARIDSAKGRATFRKGVLEIVMPKLPGAKTKGKKIEVKAE